VTIGKVFSHFLLFPILLGKNFTIENFLAQQEAKLDKVKRVISGQPGDKNNVCNVLLLFLMLMMIIFVCHSGSVWNSNQQCSVLPSSINILMYILDSKAPLLG
jgi:hypothetical protein